MWTRLILVALFQERGLSSWTIALLVTAFVVLIVVAMYATGWYLAIKELQRQLAHAKMGRAAALELASQRTNDAIAAYLQLAVLRANSGHDLAGKSFELRMPYRRGLENEAMFQIDVTYGHGGRDWYRITLRGQEIQMRGKLVTPRTWDLTQFPKFAEWLAEVTGCKSIATM